MASVIPNGSVDLLSGWYGFWDTQSHFHVGVFCILPLFLNHVSTWSCASKAPEPENTEEQTAAQTESTEAENTDLLLTMSLSIYLKPKLSPTYEFFNSCVKTELISVIKCRSINLRHLSIFGLMEWLGRLICVCCHVNTQPWSQCTVWKYPSIFINIKKKIVKHHLYLFFYFSSSKASFIIEKYNYLASETLLVFYAEMCTFCWLVQHELINIWVWQRQYGLHDSRRSQLCWHCVEQT